MRIMKEHESKKFHKKNFIFLVYTKRNFKLKVYADALSLLTL